MERRRAAGALLALAACILCTAAAPTAGNHTALDLYDGEPEGCYYNFQHYGQGDRIMTNEPCLNCTCHNRMLMCYLRVCPFTKPIGQDCTVEKRADQCCPIVTCPDVPVDLLTLTSTTSPAEYGATGVGKLDKYGCSINGKYFPEGSKVPPTPNKPCEHCYCIRNMTTCVMQECTLHVDGCTPIYHKDVCCPVRYSCDHLEDEILLLDDKTTTVRPTPGFLLTTTTNSPVTQFTQDCVHDDQIFSDGALIKTEKACEHCYCMKGDIVCVVQECGTPMENEGKNCTSLPPREGQCCPDTYICEGDELNTETPMDLTTEPFIEDLTTLSPPRRVGVEGSGYRKEVDNIPFEELPPSESEHEGSGDRHESGQSVDESIGFTTEDNTKYIYSTELSAEKEDSGPSASVEPSAEISVSTDAYTTEDHVKLTTIAEEQKEMTHEESTELNKLDSSTSIPSYDHKSETSQPELQSVTEKQFDLGDDKLSLTTIAPVLEEKDFTTVKLDEENVGTDTITIPHDKYVTTTTVSSILEDEGITTEADREQQTISTEPIKDHTYESGLHAASTTGTPFLEEVEGIPTGTYGPHVVTDGITESDIDDSSKDKTERITTPGTEDINLHKDIESTKIPELEVHEFNQFTTEVSTLEDLEKTSTTFPVDLITSKSTEETYEGEKLIPTSTSQPGSIENEDMITEQLKETSPTTQISESLDSQKLDTETEKAQTGIYEQVTESKPLIPYHDDIDITTTISDLITDQDGGEAIKASEEPVTISGESVGTESIDSDKHDIVSTTVPIHNDNLATLEYTDTNELHTPDSTDVTQGIHYDSSTEKVSEEESYDSQKYTSTVPSITEEMEMATTEFIKDQDFVTTAIIEQESMKPGEYVPSTSSTPFLEEIEKLTTEISQGHVVTDVITEKEDTTPSKQITSATQSSLPNETPADITTIEPDRGLNTIPSGIAEPEENPEFPSHEKTTETSDLKEKDVTYPHEETSDKEIKVFDIATTIASSLPDDSTTKEDKTIATTEPSSRKEDEYHVEAVTSTQPEIVTEISDELSQTTVYFEPEILSPSQSPVEEPHDIQENVPSQELTTETSKIEPNIPEKEIKPEIEDEVTSATHATPILPEITTINLGENEIDEDSILPPGRIPGEGDCLLDGVTYRNESTVPSTSKCHTDCRCVSSIIKCSPIICSSPPEYMDNCQPTYDSPDSCCPTYVCDQFRETLPPMPHIQVTTELPQQSSSTECRGDQCKIEEDKVQDAVTSELCADKECSESDIDKIKDTSSCGPHGCTDSSSSPDLCAGDECTSTSEECVNGDCKLSTTPDVVCEGKNCESSSSNLPHTPECENGVCKDDKTPQTIPVSIPCTEENGCKETDENIVQDCTDETCRRKETLDIQTKPSSCDGPDCEKQTPLQVTVETSTSVETFEIKTETPEIHAPTAESSERPVQHTVTSEKQELTTEINDYSTVSIETTQQSLQTTEIESDKEPISLIKEDESKLPVLISEDKESVTETHTKSPKIDVENDVVPTQISEDDVTEKPIDTDMPHIPTEKQPTFETNKPLDSESTEPSQYVPDTEENTIRVITDEQIPTKQLTTVSSDDTSSITSEHSVSEIEKYTIEKAEPGISDITEAQTIVAHDRTTLADISVVEEQEHSQTPAYATPEFVGVTIQPTVEAEQEATTAYQSMTEYQSVPKATTIVPVEFYTTFKESEEKATDSEIQKGGDEIYTESHMPTTESHAISFESSTQENTETYLPGATIASGEDKLSTQSNEAITGHDLGPTDKVAYVTEENVTPSETDIMQGHEVDHVTGEDLTETEVSQSTPEPAIIEHEVHTEPELNINIPETESATEIQKETEADSTPQPTVLLDKTTESIIVTQEETASPALVPHKTEEEILTPGYDVSTEISDLLPTTELHRDTDKPYEIEQEPVQTEKSETQPHETEQDIIMEPVTMPATATKLPEILSHKKEHSSESPVVHDSETEKSIEGIDTNVQEEPSIDKDIGKITTESAAQTDKSETFTEEPQLPVMKDETKDAVTATEKTETPALVPHEVSTDNIYVSDLEKSPEHEETLTVQPELHEPEVFSPVKAEPTTILTPIEKETTSDLPDVVSVTDKYDIDKIEISTDKPVSEYAPTQSYKPEIQEFETGYTEKVQTVSSDLTTKSIEDLTTEHSEVLTETSTFVAPEINEVVTEKVPSKENETPEVQETTGSSLDELVTKGDEVTTKLPDQYNTEEEMATKTQDGVTQQLESITDVPDTHITISSDEFSTAPETIPETPITEHQDISKVSDEVPVTTEFQESVTEIEQPSKTELPELEEPVKQSEVPSSPAAPETPIEESTVHYIADLPPSTVQTLSEVTDREDITLSSAAPLDTESAAVGITESPDGTVFLPESSSIKSEESSTISPDENISEDEGTSTILSEPPAEVPIETVPQIPDSEKVQHDHIITETPEPIANVEIVTPIDESHPIPEKTATEIIASEASTEPAVQIGSELHDKDESAEPTSVPVYEFSETTPYLVELQEHTHKIIHEVTTSSPIVEDITTEQFVSGDTEHEHSGSVSTIEPIVDKHTESQEPTKQYSETTAVFEIIEKSTQATVSKDEESLLTTQSAEIDIKETIKDEDKDFTTSSPTKETESVKEPTPESAITDNAEKTTEKPTQSDLAVEITTQEEINVLSTEKSTISDELPAQVPVTVDKVTKPEAQPAELPSPLPDLSKPGPSEIQPTDEVQPPDEETHFPPSGSSGYGGEPDYVEEDQAFGPGTCRYGGKVYVSAQQIPRDDPCDFCFCFRSDIICLQQSCPPPIHGCHEEPIQGFCCPRYECPVSMATTLNVTTTTTTTTTTLPPHFPTHSYKGAAQRRGCQIKGHTYKVGEVVRSSSGPCLHCTCGGDGQMKCDPKACTPEPMLRQMIAAAVSAKRRR